MTNEPDATPVFTSCTLTGYTPWRLIESEGLTWEPGSPNVTERSPWPSGWSDAILIGFGTNSVPPRSPALIAASNPLRDVID